ncbi:hypothetical protein [Nitratifractor sp.]|uniref:hypothetical protein n=1 Tax=Nitratifractor sp. TaxID=2268144 RepID=UPI0025DC60F4|nr:hypothetical protein [Nitratifractor sp.]
MKRWGLWLVSLLALVALSGCGGGSAPENETVKGGEVVVDFPANVLRQKLIAAGTPGVDENTTVFGYKAYRIEYETVDGHGMPLTASGLMVVPTAYGADARDTKALAGMKQIGLSVVSDSHGTIFADREAPTEVAEATLAPEGSPIVLTALSGFVTLQADTIGFGASKDHYHPYLLAHPSADSTVDFIRAARAFAAKNGIRLNSQLYLTGYSEGGYVAMATLHALEAADENVTYAAPMAGPYMLDQMALGVLSRDLLPIPSFMADVAYAYALYYDHNVSELVNEPYASQLSTLFDGQYTRSEIDAKLPHTVEGLFTDEAITGVLAQDPKYWFYRALLRNSTAYWGPRTPTRLVQCLGDDVVPFAMSQGTETVMKKFGAGDVDVIPVEVAITGDPKTALRYGHVQCAAPAYGVVAKLFAKVRRETIGY